MYEAELELFMKFGSSPTEADPIYVNMMQAKAKALDYEDVRNAFKRMKSPIFGTHTPFANAIFCFTKFSLYVLKRTLLLGASKSFTT